MGDIHSPRSTDVEIGNEVAPERNINRVWTPPENEENWTVFDHFQAAVGAQETDRAQVPPLFTPGWVWKQEVAEQQAKSQPPRSVDLEAIRNTWPDPREQKPPSHYTSTLDFSSPGQDEAMVWPMDGLEMIEWQKEYDAEDPEVSEVESEAEAEDEEIEIVRERIVIDLTQDDENEAAPAVPVEQRNRQAAPVARRGLMRQMILDDMKKRTQGL